MESVIFKEEGFTIEGDLLKDLVEFLNLSEDINGWLMTLSLKELEVIIEGCLDALHGESGNLEVSKIVFVSHFKGVPKDGTKATKEEVMEMYNNLSVDATLISLVKQGEAKIVDKSEANNWSFASSELKTEN